MPGHLPEGFFPEGHLPTGHVPGFGDAATRTEIDVNGYYIPVKDPDADLLLTFDWSAVLSDGVTLVSVVCTVPAGITKANEDTDAVEATFEVDIGGGLHAGLYIVSLVATLSNAQTASRDWPIRLLNT